MTDRLSVLVLAVGLSVGAGAPAERTLYVAPEGRDEWSGELEAANGAGTDGPLATLAGARDRVRALRAAGAAEPITVQLRGGRYEVAETVVFGPEDSGTPDAPITYTAYPGERPVISGGRRVSGWEPLADGRCRVRLPAVAAGEWYFRQLFADGQRLTRARYPNVDPDDPYRRGFAYVAPDPGQISGVVGNIHNVGDWMEYEVTIPAAGDYTVWVYYGTVMAPYGITDMGGRTVLIVDGGEPVPLMDLTDTPAWSPSRWSASATLSLTAGEHVIRWQNVQGGGLGLAAFLLTDDPDYRPEGTAPAPPAEGRHQILIPAERYRAYQGRQLSVSEFPGSGSKDQVACAPGTIKPAWAEAADAEVHIFPSDPHSCRAFKLIWQVAGVDLERQTIAVTGPERIVACYPGDRFFVDNLPSEIDVPGEWSLERGSGTLTLLPPRPIEEIQVVAPVVGQIVRLEGDAEAGRFVEHLRFIGLTFCENDYSPDDGQTGYGMGNQGTIHMVAARDCEVSHCRFPNIGKHAVALVRSERVTVARNQVSDGAEGGILLLDSSFCTVTDNTIERVGAIYKHIGGITLQGSGASDNLIAHNRVLDSARYGITLKMAGFRNIIEYNDLHRLSLETYDTGGIEVTQHDREQRSGSIIRHNVVADVVGYSSRYEEPRAMSWGIYLDSFAGGYTVTGNLCYRNSHGGLMVQGGKDNTITNNILVDGSQCQLYFANFSDNTRGTLFTRNIVCYRDPQARLLYAGRVDLDVMRSDENLFFLWGDPAPLEQHLAAWRERGYDLNSRVADPRFVDPEHDDYRLRPDSPALALGFEPLPLEQVGPRPEGP